MRNVIFTPGRTELAGNHTDHQNGRILASAVDIGLYAEFESNDCAMVYVQSEGYSNIEVKLQHRSVRTGEFGKPQALVRGIISAFVDLGLNVGGFNAKVKSTLPAGSGLSSSAAFGVMIGKILNELYNDGKIDPIVIARAVRKAENKYFGKPCGLMDQLTCSLGHTVYVDFKTNYIEPIKADFSSMGLTLCLTDTGGSHAGLDTSYARIPADMRLIASFFGKELLGEMNPADFRARRWDTADRPVRRATHFFDENERVPKMRDALLKGDGEAYMRLMNESGRSSEKYLNNIVTSATDDRKLESGLNLSAKLLEGKGAWRVHGGGFAGCVQALMPSDYFPEYKKEMEKMFGANKCTELKLG